jgi:hypothetical protein
VRAPLAVAAAGVDTGAYRERLQEILARREFRAVTREGSLPDVDLTPEWPSFFTWLFAHVAAVWDRLVDWVKKVFRDDPQREVPLGSGLASVSEPLALALGLVAVALIVLLVLRYRRRKPAEGEESPLLAAPPTAQAMPDALARPADAWARFAEEFGRQGEWRLALRALYLRILVVLHERGAIHYGRQRTNGEYAAVLSRGPAGEPFGRLTALFDEAWYGNKPFGEAAFNQALEWTRAVDQATAPRPGTP